MKYILIILFSLLSYLGFSQGAGLRYVDAVPTYHPNASIRQSVMVYNTTNGRYYQYQDSLWKDMGSTRVVDSTLQILNEQYAIGERIINASTGEEFLVQVDSFFIVDSIYAIPVDTFYAVWQPGFNHQGEFILDTLDSGNYKFQVDGGIYLNGDVTIPAAPTLNNAENFIVVRNNTTGILELRDAATIVPGGITDTNWGITDITATGNRIHNFDTFDLTINNVGLFALNTNGLNLNSADTISLSSTTGAYKLNVTPATDNTEDEILVYDNVTGLIELRDVGTLGSGTEVNDLSAAVTWVNVPSANITQASVTQHQAALSITESQISNLDHYTTTDFNADLATKTTANLTEGSNQYFTDERVDDRVAALIQDGTALTWTYNDGLNTLTGNVNVNGDWAGTLDGFEGSVLNQNIGNTNLTTPGVRSLTLGGVFSLVDTGTNFINFDITGGNIDAYAEGSILSGLTSNTGNATLTIEGSNGVGDVSNILLKRTTDVWEWIHAADGNLKLRNQTPTTLIDIDRSTLATTFLDVVNFNDTVFLFAVPTTNNAEDNLLVRNGTTGKIEVRSAGTLGGGGPEVNDLTAAVTWANVPNANITQSSVTQHQAALSLTQSQISDLQDGSASNEGSLTVGAGTGSTSIINSNTVGSTPVTIAAGSGLSIIEAGNTITLANTGLIAEANDLSSAVTWVNVPNANITQASVTQHQAALSITESQISDLQAYLLTEVDGSTTNEGSLTVLAGTGTTSVISSNTSGSTDVTITAGTGLGISEAGNVITLTNTGIITEVDGSVSNEGALTVSAGTASTSVINSNTAGSTPVTITAGSGLSIVESGNTITLGNAGVITETNNLSEAVTWVNVPNANITESSVTQHQAALTITRSQVSDFDLAAYTAQTATYTVLSSDEIIECTANSFTLDFPSAVGLAGKEWTVKNTGVGTITIEPNGSETIDGQPNTTLTTQYESITIFSNGTNLLIK